MAKYKLMEDSVFDNEENRAIHPKSRYWAHYQRWLKAGNTPDPEFTADDLRLKIAQNLVQSADFIFSGIHMDPILTRIKDAIEEGDINAHDGYLRIHGDEYAMTGMEALNYLIALDIAIIDISNFYNARIRELIGLDVDALLSYDIRNPNGYSWQLLPDPETFIGA